MLSGFSRETEPKEFFLYHFSSLVLSFYLSVCVPFTLPEPGSELLLICAWHFSLYLKFLCHYLLNINIVSAHSLSLFILEPKFIYILDLWIATAVASLFFIVLFVFSSLGHSLGDLAASSLTQLGPVCWRSCQSHASSLAFAFHLPSAYSSTEIQHLFLCEVHLFH